MNSLAAALIFPHAERAHLRSKTVGWIFLAVMILAASTYPSFGKKLTTAFSPLSLIFISETLMFFFAAISFGFLPTLKKLLKLKKRQIVPLLLVGTSNGILAPLLWFTGLHRTSAVNAELFGRTEMLFLLILSVFFLNQKIHRAHIAGGVVILAGIVTVALRGFTNGITLMSGDVLIMLASLIFATGGVLLRKRLHKIDPELIIFARAGSAMAFFFLVSPFMAHPFIEEISEFPVALLPALIGFGFIARFLSVFSFYEAIERLPIPTFSLMANMTIAGSTLFAHFYLGEPIHGYQAIGALLIIAGATLVHMKGIHASKAHIVHHLKTHHRQHV